MQIVYVHKKEDIKIWSIRHVSLEGKRNQNISIKEYIYIYIYIYIYMPLTLSFTYDVLIPLSEE